MKNIDILLWEENAMSSSLMRTLKKYPDLTIFSQKMLYPGIYPDIVIFTHQDPYKVAGQRLVALKSYPTAQMVYVRDFFDFAALAGTFITNTQYMISADLPSKEIHQLLVVIGNAPTYPYGGRKRTQFLNERFADINPTTLDYREVALAGAFVHGLKLRQILERLQMHEMDVNYVLRSLCRKLGTVRTRIRSAKFIQLFGSVSKPFKERYFKFQYQPRRPEYYVIPKFTETTQEEFSGENI